MNKMMDKLPIRKKEPVPAHKSWQTFEGLRDEMDSLFRRYELDFWRMPEQFPVFGREPFWGPLMGRGKVPPIDVARQDHAYEVTVELPGLDPKDVDVTFAEDMLTVTGEVREETDEEKAGLIVSERRHGAFERSLRVPEGVDPKRIEAQFGQGVLTVKLPLKPEKAAEQRTIEIKSAA